MLLPNDPENYYRQRDLVPLHLIEQLGQAKILITNFHAFKPRETMEAGKLTKSLLSGGKPNGFTELPIRWCDESAASLATKRTSSSSTTKPTIATAAERKRRKNA